jgi:hypothetical protein
VSRPYDVVGDVDSSPPDGVQKDQEYVAIRPLLSLGERFDVQAIYSALLVSLALYRI